jgi:hypothetical protein
MLFSIGTALVSWPAAAQVSCSDPDNLCTGDPCITGDIEVQSPCVLDFSPRTLIIGDTLVVPDGGTLSFTAGAIQANGPIIARGQNGSSITLTASGAMNLNNSINATGRQSPGAITLTAGGDILLDAQLKAGGPTASGGTVTVESTGGSLTTTHAGRVMVRSRTTETAGSAILRGYTSVSLAGRIFADGGNAGTIEVSSGSGDVSIEKKMRARGKAGLGGQIAISAGTAAGTVTIQAKVEAPGIGGGSIDITGSTVLVNDKVRARGLFGGAGGHIEVSATSVVQVADKIDVRGANGGMITIGGAAGATPTILVLDDLTAKGKNLGGNIDLTANGSLIVDRGVDVDAHGNAMGGCIRATAASIATGPHSDFDAGATNALPGLEGEIRFLATAGDMTLDDAFDVSRSGIIDAFASGNLTAVGRFRAGPSGCVGLDAGGTVDASGADTDPVVLSADCPGTGACSQF